MIALIIFGCAFLGLLTFAVIRVSVSCIFWTAPKPKDKQQVFKIYFPYYIMSLFGFCIIAVFLFEDSLFATYYFGSVFFLALFIWKYKMKSCLNINIKNKNTVEPNHTNLP